MVDPEKTSISYDYADVDIIVEVFRDMLVLAIVPGYKRDFKKYNLQMLAGIVTAGNDDDMIERPTVNVADLIKKRKEQQASSSGGAVASLTITNGGAAVAGEN